MNSFYCSNNGTNKFEIWWCFMKTRLYHIYLSLYIKSNVNFPEFWSNQTLHVWYQYNILNTHIYIHMVKMCLHIPTKLQKVFCCLVPTTQKNQKSQCPASSSCDLLIDSPNDSGHIFSPEGRSQKWGPNPSGHDLKNLGIHDASMWRLYIYLHENHISPLETTIHV